MIHRRGPLAVAAAASVALPGIFAPVTMGDRLLVDGGVVNNLPVDIMAEAGEGPVIAVDVTARFDPPDRRQAPGVEGRLGHWSERLRTAIVGTDEPLPSLFETIVRSIVLGSIDTAEAARQYADIVISPDTAGTGMLEWQALPRVRDAGRRAAAEALEKVPPMLLL